MNYDDETLRVFLDEAREHLDGIENDLLLIENTQEQVDKETVNKVFRAVHSVKGGAGFFGFEKIKDLTHAMESVFGLMRKDELEPTSDLVSILLESADRLKQMVHDPERMESVDIDAQLEQLNRILSGESPTSSGESPTSSGAARPEPCESPSKTVDISLQGGETIFTVTEAQIEKAKAGDNGGAFVYLLAFDLIDDIRHKAKTPWDVVTETSELTHLIESKIDDDAAASLDTLPEGRHDPLFVLVATGMDVPMLEEFLGLDRSRIHLIPGEGPPEEEQNETPRSTVPVDSVRSEKNSRTPPAGRDAQGDPPPPDVKGEKEGSIRVNVTVIDQLMALAGELVLARNQLLQGVSSGCMTSIETISQRMDLVTTDLQDAIMATRMQSIGIVFGKFRRIVRDLARSLGKHVNLVLDGEDVELDKTIIEAINDPLIHLVRNALDHGIETPEERALAGKPAAGTLKLRALHKAGQVLIEITDDGAGIDPDKVRRKAATLGLYTHAQLEEMSDHSLVQLIFRPGFSTATEVSDLSGRGVGMDVVHSNLSRLSGAIDVDTSKGKGTTVRITLPLTLAIIPALLVAAGEEQFAIPQHNLVELVRLPVDEAARRIERIGDARVLRLRGDLLPLVGLRSVLDGSAESADGAESASTEGDAFYIAVVAAGEFQYGLIVEKLLDSAEIVVKPLGKHLRQCRVYAGATILGTGRVALILDILGISQEIRTSAQKAVESERDALRRIDTDRDDDIQSLLVVENGPGEQLAIPLGLVGRIERIHRSRIETIGGQSVMKYRGGSLQLLDVGEVVPVQPRSETDFPYVIQFRTRDRDVGLVVSRIVDISRTEADLDRATHSQRGVLGSLIVGDAITLVIDPQEIAAAVLYPADERETASAQGAEGDRRKAEGGRQEAEDDSKNILVVEDSPFFLDQITSLIDGAGYRALPAKNGIEALEILKSHASGVDLVLTDIEMPELDGFGLAAQIRRDERYGTIPIIAVTSLLDNESRAKGKAAGVDEYLVKLDKEQVLERCAHYINSIRPVSRTQPAAMGRA